MRSLVEHKYGDKEMTIMKEASEVRRRGSRIIVIINNIIRKLRRTLITKGMIDTRKARSMTRRKTG